MGADTQSLYTKKMRTGQLENIRDVWGVRAGKVRFPFLPLLKYFFKHLLLEL